MRVFTDDLKVRLSRPKAVRKPPRPHDKQNHDGGETTVATVWRAFYLLAIWVEVASPVSHAQFISRLDSGGYAS